MMAFVTSIPLVLNRRSPAATTGITRVIRSPCRHAILTMTSQSPSTSSAATTPHPDSLEVTWPVFAAQMRETNVIPDYDAWHTLLDGCVRAGDLPASAIWVINLMRETGRTPVAATYERVIEVAIKHDDRVAVFHLVELMYKDKVLLGDVELPEDMENLLRSILPPESFE